MKRQIGRWGVGVVLVAGLAAGCKSSGQREQMQQDAKDKQILELTERNHRLEQDVAERDAKIAALAAQQPRYEKSEAPSPPPKAAPAARGGAKAAPAEIPASLREKGVQAATVDGHAAIRVPGSIFASGSATVMATAQTTLKQVADVIKKHPARKIRVEGNTDSDPIVKSKHHYKNNQELSEARAKAVRDALVSHGIERSRFEVVGHGASKPLADNKTSEGKRLNRRVELVFVGD